MNNVLSANTTSLSPFGAAAPGAAAKLIVFTDKKTYLGWDYNTPKNGGALGIGDGDFAADLRIIVYAVVLDDDGNIMTGRNSSLGGSANETQRLSPGGGAGRHHNITSSPNVFGNFSLIFVDDGSIPEDTAGDGIYTAIANLTDSQGPALLADHIKFNISVTDSVAGTKYTEVLITGLTCMQNGKLDHAAASSHIGDTGANAARGSDNCAVCHHGYEHWYENKSGTFKDDQLDIHAFKISGIDVTATAAQQQIFKNYRWNYSDSGNGSSTPSNWEAQVPGSKFCAQCHMKFTDGTYSEVAVGGIFDYGDGARTNDSDVPSCNDSSCHKSGKTTFEGTTPPPWDPSAMGPVKVGSNENITKAKGHNHTATNPARVACAVCHDTTHSNSLPNTTKNTTSKPINEQCWLCHNISLGALNISSNGGTSVRHTNTDCKSCHYNATTSKLDAHLVPTGIMGGRNCTLCHNSTSGTVTGKLVNFTSVNSSMHANLNKNATGNATNKPCWACHGDGTEPVKHPIGYTNPKPCEYCHVSSNFNATPVSKHYPGSVFSGQIIHSTNYTAGSCQVCHNNSIVYNNITFQLNATVSHYAGNKSYGLYDSLSSNSCSYCHNSSTVTYGVPTQISGTIHSMGGACQALCHNPNYKNTTIVNPVILHNASVGIYYNCFVAGGDGGCHVPRVR